MRKIPLVLGVVAAILAASAPARADVTSDRPAAILVWPRVVVSDWTIVDEPTDFQYRILTDTLIQVSNTSDSLVRLYCFYVNATGRCSLSDAACDPAGSDLGCPEPRDLCLPQWTETDFRVILTPHQPLAWRASRGLRRQDLPLDGTAFRGPRGESNAGMQVPPVRLRTTGSGEISLFTGELKCVVVDGNNRAVAHNAVKGEATVVTLDDWNREMVSVAAGSVSKYNAIGIQAIDGDANQDGILELGGGAGEYNACSNVLIAQHFFDFARIEDIYSEVRTELTLVPCTQNLRTQVPGSTTAQFLVFNEFEQRFSTSARVDCLFRRYLSEIDTRQSARSIFSIGVAGTLGGQTRIRGVDGGLIGLLTENSAAHAVFPGIPSGSTAFHLGMQGDRERPDFITLP